MEVIAIIGGIAIVAGIALGLVRWSRSRHIARHVLVSSVNAMMKRVADELGLGFLPERPYDHPSLGRIESFAALEGELHGAGVAIRISNEYADDYDYWMQIRVRATKAHAKQAKQRFPAFHTRFEDGWLVLEPRVKRIKTGPYTHRLILDGAVLRGLIEDVARFASGPD